MRLRKLELHEREAIFQTGYKEWPRGRTYKQYVHDNSKEDAYGTRYALVNETDEIIGSVMILNIKINQAPIFGLGSVVIESPHRNKGYGLTMLTETLKVIDAQGGDSIVMLYSEIDPNYYAKLGFKELPEKFQRYDYASAMVRCNKEQFQHLCNLPLEHIPTHF